MDLKAFQVALEQLEAERGISKDKIIETIELALAAAYKKDYGKRGQIIKAKFDFATGTASFYQVKIAVSEDELRPEDELKTKHLQENDAPARSINKQDAIHDTARESKTEQDEEEEEMDGEEKKIRFNPERHILLKDAIKIRQNIKSGEEVIFPLETKSDYGRIAAQTAKQVILQNIREAEKDSLYEEYKKREGEIIVGAVQRIENYNAFLDLGKLTAVLPKEEQVKNERYRIGERIKALIFSVQKTPRGLSIILSRTHPRFVIKLFETEVPEILNGAVIIKSIAREAGSRSKIAVYSTKEGVDPVGSCVGQKGVRVNTIINELAGEKLDIIEWSENNENFIKNSISPAKILDIEIDKEKREAVIFAEDDQLSLAIGKNGQNVRLAAKLTGYKIDIKSRTGESVIKTNEEGEVLEKNNTNKEIDENLENQEVG